MRSLQRVVERVGDTDLPVLIVGEPGTGKRSLALEIHERSEFMAGGFHEISAEKFASTLADGNGALKHLGCSGSVAGTVIIHEIGDLSPQAQQGLLLYLTEALPAMPIPWLIASR